MGQFVGRVREVAALRQRLEQRSSFVLLYGQRRCGKTYLLHHLVGSDPDSIFFAADETTSQMLLDRFAGEAVAAGRLGETVASGARADWGAALTLLMQQAAWEGRRLVLVLDECQYLLERVPALPSILQRLWDQFSPRLPLHLILCGSALTTMAALGESSQPLHGRFDLKLHLQLFDYLEAGQFATGWPAVERLRLYGTFGGLARHLAYVDPGRGLAANLCSAVLDRLAPLHFAPQDLLRSERLSAPADADAVLTALALGENRFGAIAARTGLTAPRLDFVLRELSALELIVRESRFGDRPGARFVRYRCRDPFIAFWFRFVRPNAGALLSQSPERIFRERIEARLEQQMGAVFEAIVRQALAAGLAGEAAGPIDELAPYWSRDGKTEIDLVARSGERTIFVECKWHPESEVKSSTLSQLRQHATRSGLGGADSLFIIASAGPFAQGLQSVARAEGAILLGLERLMAGK